MGRSTKLKRLAAWFRGLHRFQCFDQDSPSWDERASAAVKLCQRYLPSTSNPTPIIADLGCGNRRLQRVLEAHFDRKFVYEGYDLHPQSEKTIPLDLQSDLPPHRVDIVFVLGVLEYLVDVPGFLVRLSRFSRVAIVSYAVFDSIEPLTRVEREERGWRSHYLRDQLEALLAAAGYCIIDHIYVNRNRTVIWIARRPEPVNE